MILMPIEPFTPMHKEILDSLASGGTYRCDDPNEPWAPYLQAMVEAGWLEQVQWPAESLLSHVVEFKIAEAGLRILRTRSSL